MTDTNQTYRRLSKSLNKTRKTLSQVCKELDIDIDYVDDFLLEQHTQECSHCGIWGSDHKHDIDSFAVCKLCFGLVGR
jgi:hypothetical protein